jgi:hypothetical protein
VDNEERRRSLRDTHHMLTGSLYTCCGILLTMSFWFEGVEEYAFAMVPVVIWVFGLLVWHMIVSARRFNLLMKDNRREL